jgi:hypothetical protein
MLSDVRNLNKTRYGLGAAVVMGLMFGPWISECYAGPLARLHLPASASKARAVVQPRIELCVGMVRGASCRATFETALRTSQASATRGTLYQAFAMNRAPLAAEDSELQHQIVLKFNEDPPWKREAKVLAHDGLPFMRMPQGANRELLVGITPRGLLGVSLKDTTGE